MRNCPTKHKTEFDKSAMESEVSILVNALEAQLENVFEKYRIIDVCKYQADAIFFNAAVLIVSSVIINILNTVDISERNERFNVLLNILISDIIKICPSQFMKAEKVCH
ncbi:hypothetical protein AQUSIP_12600 [Aquicella siphonis]|uniref:Uncharacterized protein n=1 Tax=Aquicella siphonis TaxID=254247 RepID=A0A5E4PG91_9COXI|nr:hypothetical protein [Aquicella siphonis]VVC75959.1 hypothetical protein AQUSIP_12600 [Aquicella siphonis]